MTDILVDSNVLLDVMEPSFPWHSWSVAAVRQHGASAGLVINPIIFAEVSTGYRDAAAADAAFPRALYRRDELPYEVAYAAGQAFVQYRRRGGARTSPLPDFYIGAHAAVAGYRLLTRNVARYRTYFPAVTLIAPAP